MKMERKGLIKNQNKETKIIKTKTKNNPETQNTNQTFQSNKKKNRANIS